MPSGSSACPTRTAKIRRGNCAQTFSLSAQPPLHTTALRPMNSQTRRKFFIQLSTATAGAALLPSVGRAQGSGKSPNGKMNVAVIGAGGKGASDTDDVARLGE